MLQTFSFIRHGQLRFAALEYFLQENQPFCSPISTGRRRCYATQERPSLAINSFSHNVVPE